jgi:hypothetical protein
MKTLNIVSVEVASMYTDDIKCQYYQSKHSIPPSFGQVTVDKNYFISSNLRESIVWNVKTMEPIFDEDIRFVGLYGKNRVC